MPLYPSRVDYRGEHFRFFGDIEALEEDDVIWLSDGHHRIRVRIGSNPVYVLPGHGAQDGNSGQERAASYTKWKNLASLPQGTGFFVTGWLNTSTLVPIFEAKEGSPLTVVIHDVDPGEVLSRAIGTGRQRNEFWNSMSPYAFLSGVLFQLFLLLGLVQRDPNSLMMLLLVPMALLPALILAPPGIFFYFLYRNNWSLGRQYRAERDLLILPLRYPDKRLPDGGKYFGQKLEGLPEELLMDGSVSFRHVRMEGSGKTTIWSYGPHNSSDPFAEQLYIKGNPRELSHKSHRRAVYLECMSIGSFLGGLILNLIIVDFVILLFWF